MLNCKFYERNEEAYNKHFDFMKHCAAENPHPYMDGPEPERPCFNFCKHFRQHDGFPGETLICCEHPDNKDIIDCESVFDGIDDCQVKRRILDAIC